MHITVNGAAVTLEGLGNLAGLLDQLSLGNVKIAVEVNRNIVPRSEYSLRQLHDGDVVEIVQAIGGG